MTWKYPGQLAKRFVAPVPPVQRKLSDKFHTSISPYSFNQYRGNYTIQNGFRNYSTYLSLETLPAK